MSSFISMIANLYITSRVVPPAFSFGSWFVFQPLEFFFHLAVRFMIKHLWPNGIYVKKGLRQHGFKQCLGAKPMSSYIRALKFSPVDKIYIFQCMGKIFCVEKDVTGNIMEIGVMKVILGTMGESGSNIYDFFSLCSSAIGIILLTLTETLCMMQDWVKICDVNLLLEMKNTIWLC